MLLGRASITRYSDIGVKDNGNDDNGFKKDNTQLADGSHDVSGEV